MKERAGSTKEVTDLKRSLIQNSRLGTTPQAQCGFEIIGRSAKWVQCRVVLKPGVAFCRHDGQPSPRRTTRTTPQKLKSRYEFAVHAHRTPHDVILRQ
jgi:hypothetical protein